MLILFTQRVSNHIFLYFSSLGNEKNLIDLHFIRWSLRLLQPFTQHVGIFSINNIKDARLYRCKMAEIKACALLCINSS